MEIKVGITDTGRELALSSHATPDEIEAQVADALKNPNGTLVLVDEKGRRLIVPSARIGYVDIAAVEVRKVGFQAAAGV